MEARANIKDVAKSAGVSPATVSNALNHPERVKPQSLARVRDAITRLGYVRSEPARHLRSGRSKTIGLLLLDTGNPEFNRMALGVEDSVAAQGWSVLMGSSRRDLAREDRYLRLFSEHQVAGIVVTPRDGIRPELAHIAGRNTPIVLLDRFEPASGWLSVSVDDHAGGRMAAQHLIELGHRNIAFIGALDAATPVFERFSGVRERVDEEAGSAHLTQIDADLTMESGRAIGHTLARSHERPTAIITAIDILAFGILQSLNEDGIRVPDDVSICGYDDAEFSAYLSTPLTSVHRPHYRIGGAAGATMLEMLAGGTPANATQRFQPELVVRASTAPPPGPGAARRK